MNTNNNVMSEMERVRGGGTQHNGAYSISFSSFFCLLILLLPYSIFSFFLSHCSDVSMRRVSVSPFFVSQLGLQREGGTELKGNSLSVIRLNWRLGNEVAAPGPPPPPSPLFLFFFENGGARCSMINESFR
jgi:hypothetical protein